VRSISGDEQGGDDHGGTVRITVDLALEDYRTLTEWTAAQARELGISRLSLADAVRGMVRATAADAGMSASVVRAIRRDKGR